MTFESRGKDGRKPPAPGNSLDSLVDQIADEVRSRLIHQGVPLGPGQPAASSALAVPPKQPQAAQPGGSPFQAKAQESNLAAMIDHTLLKPDATREEIEKLCAEARSYGFATVCVNSAYVGHAAELLRGCPTKAIAVVGFPLGAAATSSKAFEAREAIQVGAQEIDMVINIGALKGRDYSLVLEDIREVVEASKPYPVKVILETASLSQEEKVIACALSKAAGAAFVKTSTGFGAGGATVEDIQLMRRVVGPEMGVKASGGVRTHDDALKMIAAGANRLGTSSSIAIVTQAKTGAPSSNSSGQTEKKTYKSSLY